VLKVDAIMAKEAFAESELGSSKLQARGKLVHMEWTTLTSQASSRTFGVFSKIARILWYLGS